MIDFVAIAFPGQGTQTPGMGSPWQGRPEWDAVIERAENALGETLRELVLEADDATLARTRNAQLAVLLTSLLAWEAIREHVSPVAFAGHSLGQVTALIASGVMTFDDGVRFAAVRAERTQASADANPGVMAALLGATIEQAEAGCAAAPDTCWIANDNAPGQVVLAGTPDGVDAGTAAAKHAGARTARRLAVGGAFHTPLMGAAADALVSELAEVALHEPAAPVISNDDGAVYSDGEGWRDRSARHVATRVNWRLVQPRFVELGASQVLEVGHGTMLAALAKRTITGTPVIGIATPAHVDGLLG